MRKHLSILLLFLFVPITVFAQDIVGKIQSISTSAKVIQYINPKTKEVAIIKFSDQTQLIDAESFEELTVNTKFKAMLDSSGNAVTIKPILVKLPLEKIIDTDTLFDLLDAGKQVFIGDARPINVYNVGHIPTAKPTPANKLQENIEWLPKNKEALIVFYCGGVTCPLSPSALNIAQQNGYTNVKAYVAGFPAWKNDVYPAHVNADWLIKHLDIHHVIIDIREQPDVSVKGAVSLSLQQLVAQDVQMNLDKVPTSKRTIFNLRDKKVPIILVADKHNSEEAIEAYEILSFWKFKNVSILNQGLDGWRVAKLPTKLIDTKLVYIKKLVKGAIEESAFVKAAKEGSAMIIDLRDPEEIMHGRIKGAINIPLSDLDKQLTSLPMTTEIILHCASGSRAALGYTLLTKMGYSNVRYLNDSFSDVVKDNAIALL